MKRWLLVLLLLVLGGVGFWLWTRPPEITAPPQLNFAASTPAGSFARAVAAKEIDLPLDHGPHFEYQTEWWYYTGNLQSSDGRHFGYQLTFFRRGLTPNPADREAAMAADQLYFAHFALIDVAGGQHQEWERFSRGAAGLAGAQSDPLRIWLENWSADGLNEQGSRVRLQAEADGVGLDLVLDSQKPIVGHGQDGLSPKSDEVGNASYYLSYTRMTTEGTLNLDGELVEVEGNSWFDHEWSTSALGPQAVGWDWFSLQLSDGREIMYFQIRQQDGSIEPVSSGTLIEVDGSTRTFDSADIQVDVLDQWRSPESGAVYPSQWRLELPMADLAIEIEPWLADQEMNVSFTYWEGAVRFEGTSQGEPISGVGFIEMTGYAESMQGTF